MKNFSFLIRVTFILLAIVLTGCRASGNQRAPVEDRVAKSNLSTSDEKAIAAKRIQNEKNSKARENDARGQIYIVQKGDTLYSIAFDNGLDYREVAEQNNIENPSAIQIGQEIRLYSQDDDTNDKSRSDNKSSQPSAQEPVQKKEYPKMIKLPYSEMAVSQIEKLQMGSESANVVLSKPVSPVVKPVIEPARATIDTDRGGNDDVDWNMPTKGKIIGEYSESANRKGVDIAGSRGQPIMASASGKVVYSGSGLRGYGKLVIIKHNKTYLSAYAHNEQILVKEGQFVTKGQKIAEMGSSDTDQVKLHFEIRRFGKPIDPAKFLSLGKS